MDISRQFSLTDFLAYFFPGIFAATGIYVFIQMTPLKAVVTISSLDITTGILFLVLSYIIGVISSGFSNVIVKQIEKITNYKDPHNFLPPARFPNEVKRAFYEVFGIEKKKDFEWTRNHYYLCRSIVIEKMPAIAPRIARQSDMALFRRNLIFPLLVWTVIGIGWGVANISNNARNWGIVLIALSLVISFLVIRVTIQRMHNSTDTETRETLVGFLVGYKTMIIGKQNKSSMETT